MYVPPRVTLPSDHAALGGLGSSPTPGTRSGLRDNRRAGPPPRRPAAPPEGQPWWIWLLAVLAVVLLGAIGFLGAQVLGALGPGQTPIPSASAVTVPNWVGDPIAGVREEAGRLDLELVVVREPNDEVEVDRVISTDPVSGETVAKGDTITVVVSNGAEEVNVPVLIGQTRAEAAATLVAAGLVLGAVGEEPSDRPSGTVISTVPGAGVTVGKGSQVDLVLSLGPTPSPSPTPTPLPTPTPTPLPTPTPVPGTPVPSESIAGG